MPNSICQTRFESDFTYLHGEQNSVKQKILPNKTCAFNTAVNLAV